MKKLYEKKGWLQIMGKIITMVRKNHKKVLSFLLVAALLGGVVFYPGPTVRAEQTPDSGEEQIEATPETVKGGESDETVDASSAEPQTTPLTGDNGQVDIEDKKEADTAKAEPLNQVKAEESLLKTAKQSGEQAAQQVNAYTDEQTFYAALREVLNLYFSEDFPTQREAFLTELDVRGAAVAANYLAAEAERSEGKAIGFVPGEVLLTLHKPCTADKLSGILGFAVNDADVVDLSGDAATVYRVNIPLEYTVEQAVAMITANAAVEQAQPNYVYKRSAPPVSNDPLAGDGDQWYLNKINVADAWDVVDAYPGHARVRVAVVDGSVDLTHPDLVANLNTALAVDLTNPSVPAPITDKDWHATSVAGILGGVANNNVGIAGIGSGRSNQCIEIVPVNIFTGSYATSASLVAGIDYATNNGAQVINLSVGDIATGAPSDTFEADAVTRAHAAGATVVVAAGNDSSETLVITPSDNTDAIKVIAIKNYTSTAENPRVPASNYGIGKDISAPGVGLTTTTVGGTGYTSGFGNTSGATPVVAGVVALMYYIDPTLTANDVRTILGQTAIDLHTPGKDNQTAWGMVNAGAAVAATEARLFPLTGFTLDATTASLTVGSTQTLSVASYIPTNTTSSKAETWVSSNPAVATVDGNGLVTAVGAGTAVITCTVAGISENCTVTVAAPVYPLTGFTLNMAATNLTVGGTQALSVTAYIPANTTSSKAETWTSSNPAVATVDGNGLVTAVADGNAVITCTVAGISETCAVTVTTASYPLTGFTLNMNNANLTVGGTQALSVTAYIPANTTSSKAATWTSSNPSVATVDGNGLVTAVAAGNAVITCTVAGVSETCNITVAAQSGSNPGTGNSGTGNTGTGNTGTGNSGTSNTSGNNTGNRTSNNNSNTRNSNYGANTGDHNIIWIWFALIVAAMLGAGIVIYRKRRHM